MTYADQDAGVAGYRYLGLNKNGLWGKYVPSDHPGKSWQEIEEEKRQRRLAREREQRREQKERKEALPVEERSQQFQALFRQLHLKPEDIQDLLRRGLTPEQIQAGLFRSVKPGGMWVEGVDQRLPGMRGDRLYVPDEGYLVPIRDVHGRTIGCQLRLRWSNKGGKYRWLVGHYRSHLPNGELPINVARAGATDEVWVSEGMLKSYVASCRHNKTFLGASGGNYTSSLQQLREALAILAPKVVTVAPDAGAVANRQVYRRDCETIRLLLSWGYQVRVADWGQLWDKGKPDVDELDSLDEVHFVSAQEYLALGEQPKQQCSDELPIAIHQPKEIRKAGQVAICEGLEFKPAIAAERLGIPVIGFSDSKFDLSPKKLREALKDLEAKQVIFFPDAGAVLDSNILKRLRRAARMLLGWGYEVSFAWWHQTFKSAGDIDKISDQKLEKIEYLTDEEFARKAQFLFESWKAYKQNKSFTPIETANTRYLHIEAPRPHTVTFVKSPMDTGKTTWLLWLAKQLEGYGFVSLGYRNTLLLQFCERSGFYHLHEDAAKSLIADPLSKIALCVDSLHHFQPEDFEGKILILDEVVSVLKHLLFSRTIKDRRKIIDKFCEAIRRCDRVICLDAMMQDWVVSYLRLICPEKLVHSVENTWKQELASYVILEGTIAEDGGIKANDRAPWLDLILNGSKIPVVCSDNLIFLEALEEKLVNQGRKGILVSSKTVSRKDIKQFLENPERFIEENQPEYLLYSPSAESGLDISIKGYFTEQFGFFFGTIDADSILQQMGRLRDIEVTKYLWVKSFVPKENLDTAAISSPFEEQLEYAKRKIINRDLYLVMSGEKDEAAIIAEALEVVKNSSDQSNGLAMRLQAMSNFERGNLRECVRYLLESKGYPLQSASFEHLAEYKEINAEIKQLSEAVRLSNARDIFNAKDLPPTETEHLAFDSSWERRCEIMKANLCGKLPGIRESEAWSPELIKAIKYDDPKLIKKLELRYLLHHPEVAKRLSQERYHTLLKKGLLGERACPWELRHQYLLVETLRRTGILNLKEGETYEANSPEIKAIVKACKDKSVIQVLGRSPGKDPVKFVGSLLKMIGYGWRSKQYKTKEGKNRRCYQLSIPTKTSAAYAPVSEAIARRWSARQKGEVEQLNWQFLKDKQPEKPPEAKTTSTPDRASISAVADRPTKLYKTSQKCYHITSLNPERNTLPQDEVELRDLATWLGRCSSPEALEALLSLGVFSLEDARRALGYLPAPARSHIISAIVEVQRRAGPIDSAVPPPMETSKLLREA